MAEKEIEGTRQQQQPDELHDALVTFHPFIGYIGIIHNFRSQGSFLLFLFTGCRVGLLRIGKVHAGGILHLELLPTVLALDVQAGVDQNGESNEQEEHLERREIGHLHSAEIVADHVAGAQHQVAERTEHTTVAKSPHVEKQKQGILERVAAYRRRLSATWTVVALIVGAAGGTVVLLVREWLHLMGLLLPLLETAVFLLQLLQHLRNDYGLYISLQ